MQKSGHLLWNGSSSIFSSFAILVVDNLSCLDIWTGQARSRSRSTRKTESPHCTKKSCNVRKFVAMAEKNNKKTSYFWMTHIKFKSSVMCCIRADEGVSTFMCHVFCLEVQCFLFFYYYYLHVQQTHFFCFSFINNKLQFTAFHSIKLLTL